MFNGDKNKRITTVVLLAFALVFFIYYLLIYRAHRAIPLLLADAAPYKIRPNESMDAIFAHTKSYIYHVQDVVGEEWATATNLLPEPERPIGADCLGAMFDRVTGEKRADFDKANNYFIQVGIVSTESEAKEIWNTLSKQYAKILSGSGFVIKKNTNGRLFFLVIIGPYSNKHKAMTVCNFLKKRKQHCVIMP